MTREQHEDDMLEAVTDDALENASGGRTVSASATSGADPALLAGVQNLVKAFGSINDNMKAAQKQNQQQVMQTMMQKLMG